MPILVCLQKNSDFRTIRETILKSQLFSKSTLNLARFDTKFVAVRKILLSTLCLMAGKFGKFGLKALFVSCAFIFRVAEATADHESMNEDFRGCSRDNKPVFIAEEINK